jgi:4-amino-4-deoxy-L-arabinose transferase-like glycosyltransferase
MWWASKGRLVNRILLKLRERLFISRAVLIIIFALALVFRLYSLETVRIPSERQYRSAIIARAYYYKMKTTIPEWKKEVAEISRQRVDLLEPPLQEMLTAVIYRLIDQENLWIPRFLSALFWIVGGLPLYLIARRWMSEISATFVTFYYLFIPIGVLTSISFQPDSLMMMAFLTSLLGILRYAEQPSRRRLLAAALISGIAILIRPLCLFAISGAFLAVALYLKFGERRFRSSDVLVFLGICFLLPLTYYGYTIASGRFIADQAEASFIPSLLLDKRYWTGWMESATRTVGLPVISGGLLGLVILPNKMHRSFLIGLWGGYVIFCLTFTYHIRFSNHYHLQLAVIAALSFGILIDEFISLLKSTPYDRISRFVLAGALLLVLILNFQEIRRVLGAVIPIEQESVARKIGELVHHSTQTVYLASAYGMPLEYYGELSGAYWPRREVHWALQSQGLFGESTDQKPDRSLEERFQSLDFIPQYFIITNFSEFNIYHSDLKEYLLNNSSLIAQSRDYLIYQMSLEK